MTKNLITRLFLVALSICALSTAAFAMDLTSAKSSGLVGEMPNGLIGPVNNATGVDDLIKSVNDGRMKIYTQNAVEQNLPIDQIQQIAGKKIQSATPAGQFIQDEKGEWIKK